MTTDAPPNAAAGPPPADPELRVTLYDRVSSLLLAFVLALVVAVAYLGVRWATQHVWDVDDAPPMELVAIGGGEEDGLPDESQLLENLAEEIPDPSLSDLREDEVRLEEMLPAIVDLADQAADPAPAQVSADLQSSGKAGSAGGTGGAALGLGPGEKGVSAEQRWFVSFSDRGSLDSYAEQLDHFGIELGALLPGGELVLVSGLSGTPKVRRAASGKDEQRLYMIWQGGGRKTADVALFKKGGVEVGGAPILHFYPGRTERQLLTAELNYRNRGVGEIRRTYFAVSRDGGGYKFTVTRQTYL